MANLTFNIALGRVAELYRRVDAGDPATARLLVVVIDAAGATDETIRDYDTLADLIGDVNVVERNTNGWTRKTLAAADIAYAPDDVNNRVDLDIADQTWTTVLLAGGASTDLVVAYDPDPATSTESTRIPLTLHDFAVTPDGSNVTGQIAAAGFFRASPV